MSLFSKITLIFFLSFAFSMGFNFFDTAIFSSITPATQYGSLYKAKTLLTDRDADKGIIFGGDVMLARDVESKMLSLGVEYPFLQLKNIFSGQSVFANFEAPISKNHISTPNGSMNFSVDNLFLEAVKEAGFTHFSLANNHTLDKGEAGLTNTISELSKAGLIPVGRPDEISSSSVSFIQIGQKTAAVIAFDDIDYRVSFEKLLPILDFAKNESDLQIAFMHWGDEYVLRHSPHQEVLAHNLVDLGVDIVIGAHPHVVEDIEMYNHSLIFYSLGNLIFDQYFSPDVMEGLLLKLSEVDDDFQVDLVPLESQTAHASPREMNDEEASVFLQKIADRSSSSLQSEIKKGSILLPFALSR